MGGIASIAAALIAGQVGQMQSVMAAKMMKMNADASADAAKLLQAASQNFDRLANVASGIGGNLDITA
jgi:hypothetical protein